MNDIKSIIQNIIKVIDERIPKESNPQKLMLIKGKYQAVLSELEKDNLIETNIDGVVRQYMESYSDYVNHSLFIEMEKVEKMLNQENTTEFISSKKCYNNINQEFLNGNKIPHSISQPVIYLEDGKYYLSSFLFFYTKEDIEDGRVERPTMWAIADIQTGKIIQVYETKEKDFSDAPYDIKYNIRADGKYDTSKEYYDEAFSILDSVRSKMIKDGKFYKGEYQYYFDMILANIPREYQRFYTDLSV